MVHATTSESPYFVLHGKDPNFPSRVKPELEMMSANKMELDDYKSELVAQVKLVYQLVKETTQKERERMKKYYDKKGDGRNQTISWHESVVF